MYDLAKNKSPNLWEKIKKLNSPPSKPNLEIIMEDGSVSRDTDKILKKWFTDISRLYSGVRDNPEMVFDEDFYKEILEKKAEFESMNFSPETSVIDIDSRMAILNADITYNEVSKAIDNTKIGKAYLSIPNDVLKNNNAKKILHKFFAACYASGLNPVEWDYSDIKPIPKPEKDSRDPLQNRCITILCCVAKVFTSILNKRIQTFLELSEILVDEQNGFRSGRSCIDHLFALVTILRNRKELGKDTFLAFIDFKKAFDLVDRNMLLYKLAVVGIRGQMYTAIASLYNNPQSRVVLNDHETDYFNCPMGVKQGDCLSPTLFALYINDLALEIKESNIGVKLDCLDGNDSLGCLGLLLYADDIVCLAECEEDLQSILFIVEGWCRRWRLEVNLTKTNIMHVRRQRKTMSRFTFFFDWKPVPYCSDYKYLGSNINEFLSFKFTVEKHSLSAGRALSAIITKMIKNSGFQLNVYSLLLNACVNSVSDYSAAITGFEHYDSLLKVQLKAVRAFLGLPKNACNPGVLSEVDLLLPHYRTRLDMIRCYHRMLCMDYSRITKRVYTWDKNLNESGKIKTWYSEIREILASAGLEAILSQERPFNLKSLIDTISSSFKSQQKEQLANECKDKPKLRTFVRFKNFEGTPAYTSKFLTFHQRRAMAKLRLGCLPLRIETGRYTRPRLDETDRICLLCKPADNLIEVGTVNNPIEDEIHFLLQCSAYEGLRTQWYQDMPIPDNFKDLEVEHKLDMVLNNPQCVKKTSQFILNCLDHRSKLID